MQKKLEFLLTALSVASDSISVPYLLGVALLVIVAGTVSCSAPPPEQAAKPAATPAPVVLPATVTDETHNPLTDMAAAAIAGRALYQANCALCHGNTGAGDGLAGESFNPKPTRLDEGDVVKDPDGEIFLALKNGKGKMPAMKKLTDEQIWQVVAFVRTLAKH